MQIDHDPNEKRPGPDRSTLAIALMAGGIGFYNTAPKYAHLVWDWRDTVATTVLVLLLFWLLGPSRRDTFVDAESHERARQGFAFRLGKSLNRVRRRFGRRF